ncbi:hypothetical protein ACT2CI_00310 [Candidatus Vidania fulgoroideorum]
MTSSKKKSFFRIILQDTKKNSKNFKKIGYIDRKKKLFFLKNFKIKGIQLSKGVKKIFKNLKKKNKNYDIQIL